MDNKAKYTSAESRQMDDTAQMITRHCKAAGCEGKCTRYAWWAYAKFLILMGGIGVIVETVRLWAWFWH